MTVHITDTQSEALSEVFRTELKAFRSTLKALGLGHKRLFSAKWSNGLTSSAGRYKASRLGEGIYRFKVTISAPIFRQAVQDHGLDKTLQYLKETIKHELGHILEPEDHHGSRWAKAVELLGGKPQKYHDLTAGSDLFPEQAEIKQRYPIGASVTYQVEGETYQGQILRHNIKRVSISAPGRTWKIPYSKMDEVIQEVL